MQFNISCALIGTVWFRKSYPCKDYVIVVLLMAGLVVFITGRGSSPESTTQGNHNEFLILIYPVVNNICDYYCLRDENKYDMKVVNF